MNLLFKSSRSLRQLPANVRSDKLQAVGKFKREESLQQKELVKLLISALRRRQQRLLERL